MFGNIATQQYPALFKDTPIPDVKDIEDKSFITGAQARMSSGGAEGEAPQYAANETGPVVSKRSYSINFDTGKATFTQEGVRTMSELKDSLAITGLFIQVDGYTDNTGSEGVNQALSDARAAAVKDWLQKHAPRNFPDNRFKTAGHGSQNPVATNDTAPARPPTAAWKLRCSGS